MATEDTKEPLMSRTNRYSHRLGIFCTCPNCAAQEQNPKEDSSLYFNCTPLDFTRATGPVVVELVATVQSKVLHPTGFNL